MRAATDFAVAIAEAEEEAAVNPDPKLGCW